MSQLLIKRRALYRTTRRCNPCLELPPNCWHLCQPGKSELLPCGTRACAITMGGSAQVSVREAGRCVPYSSCHAICRDSDTIRFVCCHAMRRIAKISPLPFVYTVCLFSGQRRKEWVDKLVLVERDGVMISVVWPRGGSHGVMDGALRVVGSPVQWKVIFIF